MLTASNEGMERDEEGLDQRDTHRLAEVERARSVRADLEMISIVLDISELRLTRACCTPGERRRGMIEK